MYISLSLELSCILQHRFIWFVYSSAFYFHPVESGWLQPGQFGPLGSCHWVPCHWNSKFLASHWLEFLVFKCWEWQGGSWHSTQRRIRVWRRSSLSSWLAQNQRMALTKNDRTGELVVCMFPPYLKMISIFRVGWPVCWIAIVNDCPTVSLRGKIKSPLNPIKSLLIQH